MVRPKCDKKVNFCPKYKEFKPEGCTKNADLVYIDIEEAEALRLKNIENLSQKESANRMGISQSTFQRILVSAYKKVTSALIGGKIIKLNEK
ncbi:MAG: DUF134 domain-containing protein [Candidatus Nomurabacteria bacterium]|nr:DUF134 domain-containing protein [Candidatus Nomurabacteria bacterium]